MEDSSDAIDYIFDVWKEGRAIGMFDGMLVILWIFILVFERTIDDIGEIVILNKVEVIGGYRGSHMV